MHSNKIVSRWLLTIMSLIVLIIIVGGITRLTNSGLSMPFWDLIEILPPLNESEWMDKFEEYKRYPDYRNQTIEEFKSIYWWEYIHRIIGRIIGMVALFPFIYFIYKKYLTNKEKKDYAIILFLILIQGVVGLMMVKSGLNPSIYNKAQGVSPFWLLVHLILALLTYSYALLQYLKLNNSTLINLKYKGFNFGSLIFTVILFQIMLGALMSGFKAGYLYQSFPLMDGQFYPSKATLLNFNNPHFIHFFHRWFAFLLFAIVVGSFFKLKDILSESQIFIFRALFYTFIFQIIFGIFSVLNPVIPFAGSIDSIVIALIHQIGSIVLISLGVILAFSFSNK